MKKAFMLLVFLSLCVLPPAALSAAEKDPLAAEYEALSQSLEQKMAGVKSREDYQKFMAERNSALEALLLKYAADPAGPVPQLELVRARILVDLKKYPEAEAKLTALTGKPGPQQDEARLVLARLLTETEKIAAAVPLYKQVEAKVARSVDFFAVAVALAFEAPDDAVRKEYCQKLLAAADLPKQFSEYRVYLVTTLAEIETKKRNLAAAKKILQDGLKDFSGERETKTLQAALKQLEFIGKPAPAISAEKWLNSAALSLERLKGKVVIIDFWAPWCPPCRKVIPTLVKDFNELKDKGLVVMAETEMATG